MNKAQNSSKLVQVKLALAGKYEKLAKLAKSKPRQKRLLHQAQRYLRQVHDLSPR